MVNKHTWMDQEKLKDLLLKHHSLTATPEEMALLESWYLKEAGKQNKLSPEEVEAAEKMMADHLRDHIKPESGLRTAGGNIKFVSWLAVAALLCIMIPGLLWYAGVFSLDKKEESYVADIKPGKNAATLTLANGKRIVLSDVVQGEVVKESGVLIRKSSDGIIEYLISDQDYADAEGVNILSTAKGETYRLRLPDGTSVWLNAASSLKFPVSFAKSKSRNVELSGEAYFEIFKDKSHPFVVSTDRQEVRVLGTHFNMSSYPDEPDIRTTLIEGSVKVIPLKLSGAKEILLKPGQRSRLFEGKLEVTPVDIQEETAWKNGDFIFRNEHIESIMRKLSRWYDIDVRYEGEMADLIFIGVVSRSKNISSVLKVMESTGNVRFKIEGRRVTVKR
jgi:transmembrane sensor